MAQEKRSHIVTDQMGRSFVMEVPVERIVCLVPSITELLFDIGVGDKVVGRTKFCIHPLDQINRVPVMGGTKMIHHDRIHDANPDLIISNKEENNKEDIDCLEEDYSVWVSDISTLDDSYSMIRQLGELLNRNKEAERIIVRTEEILSEPKQPERSAIYLIWKDPYMTVGGDTYIHSILSRSGYKNLFANQMRYPQLTLDDIVRFQPDELLLSSEPFPFKKKHINELQESLPDTKIKLVNGEFYAWYGSRILKCGPDMGGMT